MKIATIFSSHTSPRRKAGPDLGSSCLMELSENIRANFCSRATAAAQFSQWSCRHLPADHHTLLNKATSWFRDVCGPPAVKGRLDSQSGPNVTTQALGSPRTLPACPRLPKPFASLIAGVARMATPALGHQLGVAETMSVGLPVLTPTPNTDRKSLPVSVKPV